jgi:hypothetical protein
MTAYKYVARDEESRVNWGDISKTWSDAILKVEADRETKRQTIKTETDELANKLIAAPRGQHKGANEWTAQYADMQREALLDRYRQLTSGNLPLREWNSALANATQSTEQMFNLSKVYQEEYASIMERDQNLESQEAELALAAEFEGFTNFTDTVPLVDPVTLGARIGKQTYDPETGTYKVGETVTMNQMYNLLKGRYNRFDIQAATAEDIKSLGKYTTVVMDGEVKTRENWQDDPLYKEELNAKIAVHFSDPQNITSVLTNSMNSGYSPTGLLENALDKDGNVDEKKVFWVTNPAQASAGAKTPLIALDIQLDGNGNITGRSEAELDDIFGEDVSNEQRSALVRAAKKQEEEAAAFMRTYYTAEVDLIETPQAERTKGPTSEEIKQQKGAQRTVDVVTNIRKLHSLKPGESEEDVDAATSYVQQLNPNVRKIDLREDEIVIRMKDGNLIPITKGDEADLFVESIINAVYKDKAVNLPDALKKAGVYDEGLTRHSLGAIAGFDETVGYGDEIQGFDDEGKLIDVTPRSSYVASTDADDSSTNVTSAALGALSAMNFDNPQVSVLEIDRINDIDLPGTQSVVFGNRFEDAVKYFVPEVMPYQVFVPEDGANNVVGRLNELVAEARAQGRQVTIEELKAAIGPNNYEIYNTQTMRDANPIEFGAVENPNENTPEVDAFGNPI